MALPMALDSYGSLCFNRSTMEKYLDPEIVAAYDEAVSNKKQLSQETMDKYAAGVLKWAVENSKLP